MANKFGIDDPTTVKNFAERMLPAWTVISKDPEKSGFRRAGHWDPERKYVPRVVSFQNYIPPS